MDDTDLPLLRLVAAGDEHAFELLYTRHAHALLAYAQGLLRDRGTAEEALQETFIALWRSAHAYEGRSTVRTWLYGICRRQALKRMNGDRPAPHPLDEAAHLPSTEPDPETVALARADTAAVAAALTTLPATHREVLTLALSDGLSHAEISQILDIPVGTVKSRLFTARATLAKALPVEAEGRPR